ncbi:MAG: hypothetical protein H6744_16175 [Deltaproteobacteria bacterium]|nr:hypothetical protein [Deltaproteobacteria bacterium]MCB9788220.1 hypothetical protein [Deltaproteobacteria bacterium]
MKARARACQQPTGRLLPLLALCALGGCFESGPLGVGLELEASPTDASEDRGPGPDVSEDLPIGTPDARVDADAAADATADAGTPCTFDGQCAGAGADLCVAPVRCIDFTCQPDPAWVAPCEASADPCVEVACVPSTGACVPRPVCTCEPASAPLACGAPRGFSTADAGATAVVSGYSCGGAAGAFPEHAFRFTAAATQGVEVTLDGGAAGGVYVLEGEGACDPSACVAGGTPPFVFAAVAGRSYLVVVEHSGGPPVALSLRLDCGLGPETHCQDGADDDMDGATDCADADCVQAPECLQTCTPTPDAIGCGFSQELSTATGASSATDYPCGPPSPGPEIAYRFQPQAAGVATATLSSAQAGARLYVLRDQGFGCAPETCETWDEAASDDPAVVKFVVGAGQTWYLVVDGAEASQALSCSLALACEP